MENTSILKESSPATRSCFTRWKILGVASYWNYSLNKVNSLPVNFRESLTDINYLCVVYLCNLHVKLNMMCWLNTLRCVMGVESIFKALLFDCTFSSVVLNCIKSISEGKIVKSRDGKFLDNFRKGCWVPKNLTR